MSGSDRRKYLTTTVLDQAFLDWSHDNLENRLEMVIEIETPTGTIYASDRNKYVGSTFYEALCNFPLIRRTVGEWLAPTLQFSQLTVTLSNVDGRFNDICPHGANYGSWVGKTVRVKIGVGETASTYQTIFFGYVTEVGGFQRGVKSVTINARDAAEKYYVNFPTSFFDATAYPTIEDNYVGKYLPVIYGDWTTALDPDPAIVPAVIVNGKDGAVAAAPWNNLQLVISSNANKVFDTTNVYLRRGDVFYLVPAADVVNVNGDKNYFEIDQNTANTWVEDPLVPYTFQSGDEFYVRVKGVDLGAYDDNIVEQARHILMTYGGAVSGDFDASWDSYRDKAAPSQSAIVNIKSRIWEDEPKQVIQYALSLLEQVRLEAFIDRDLNFKINSLHFEDFPTSISYPVRNWDIARDTFTPQLDVQNNFNRARGAYDFRPIDRANFRNTEIYANLASVAQIGRRISKEITFPNLYVAGDPENQLIEIIRLSSSFLETVDVTLTWRSLLQDIGDFMLLRVDIGGTIFDNVPAMIREMGYDPRGVTIPVRVWSFGLCPYPGYVPGYTGSVGGYAATINIDT